MTLWLHLGAGLTALQFRPLSDMDGTWRGDVKPGLRWSKRSLHRVPAQCRLLLNSVVTGLGGGGGIGACEMQALGVAAKEGQGFLGCTARRWETCPVTLKPAVRGSGVLQKDRPRHTAFEETDLSGQ